MSFTPEWMRMMAQYNAWQNDWMVGAAGGMTADTRLKDRCAFFGSIHGTLSHILWADTMWMSRLAGGAAPDAPVERTTQNYPDWDAFVGLRAATDAQIVRWADGLTQDDLSRTVSFWSGTKGADLVQPKMQTYTHFFNHQTHHRGQIHAMLTGAGVSTPDTDLLFMEH